MFSVIVPVHNKLPHLDRSINSVLNQSFKDFELIVIDDASSDGSEERIKEYTDPRIRTFKRDIPGPGGYAARNLGIKKAKYEWIAFLDADDEWKTDHLEEKFTIIQKYSDVELVSTNWVYSKEEKITPVSSLKKIKEKHREFSLIDYLNYNLIVWTSAVSIKKQVLISVGSFPEEKCKRSGDMDTWIRCLYKSKRNLFINKVLAVYYVDTVNRVTDFDWNPSLDFCPLKTIRNMRKNVTDRMLLKAIDNYCAKHISFRMMKEMKMRKTINLKRLNDVHSWLLRLKIIIKLYLYKLILILRKKQ